MLAIVIPYHKLQFFEFTLASLAAQTNKGFAVYIGNDASSEDPQKIIEKYKGRLNISYEEFTSNLGSRSLVRQWNRCIQMTQNEEWIMILGDDDVLEENVVESWYNYYDRFVKKTYLVRFATRIIDENSQYMSDIFIQPKLETAENSFLRKFRERTRSSLSEYVFLKKAHERNGFTDYPLAWYSDDKAWLDFSEGKPIYSINQALVHIRNSPLSISGKSSNLEQKCMAAKIFYKDVIDGKVGSFGKLERLSILRAYEDLLVKTESFKSKEKLRLLLLYIRYFDSTQFQKYLKRTYHRWL